jgi:hypothetical protein
MPDTDEHNGTNPDGGTWHNASGYEDGMRKRAQARHVGGLSVKRLTDPRALRALAHPIRLSLVGLLRIQGPLTATRAADLLGESSGSCSFHLRQLAKYGLVEEAGGGQGRERPWRATAVVTRFPEIADTPELGAAKGLLETVLAEFYFENLMRWLEAKPGEPVEWQQAAVFGDTNVYLTAAELAELGRAWISLLQGYAERFEHPELRPAGARLISVLHLAHPRTAAADQARSGQPEPAAGLADTRR